jgi:hypothetical protein
MTPRTKRVLLALAAIYAGIIVIVASWSFMRGIC